MGKQYTNRLGVAFLTFSSANRLRHNHPNTAIAIFPIPVGTSTNSGRIGSQANRI
jgi:hypothetical protein